MSLSIVSATNTSQSSESHLFSAWQWLHGKYILTPRRHIYKYVSSWWVPSNSLRLYSMMLSILMPLSWEAEYKNKSDNFWAHSFQDPSQTFFFRFVALFTSEWYKTLGWCFLWICSGWSNSQNVWYPEKQTRQKCKSHRKKIRLSTRLFLLFLGLSLFCLLKKEVQEVI